MQRVLECHRCAEVCRKLAESLVNPHHKQKLQEMAAAIRRRCQWQNCYCFSPSSALLLALRFTRPMMRWATYPNWASTVCTAARSLCHSPRDVAIAAAVLAGLWIAVTFLSSVRDWRRRASAGSTSAEVTMHSAAWVSCPLWVSAV
jgi:hypothetical protein